MLGTHGLFNPTTNRFLVKMDDSTSMQSLALRDGVESSGRTVMEYKRDKNGGRERLIEEIGTMVIWAFGVNWMKKLSDQLAKNVFKTIELPHLDTSLLKQVKIPPVKQGIKGLFQLFQPPSAQSLLSGTGTIKESIKPLSSPEILNQLSRITKQETARYARYNTGKFLFATGLPTLAIAFGIPAFNHWLTKRLNSKSSDPSMLPKGQEGKIVISPSATKLQGGQSLPKSLPVNTPLWINPSLPTITNPYNTPNNFYATPTPASPVQNGFNQAGLPPSPGFVAAESKQHNPETRFGGNPLNTVAAALLQDERMNTLLIDTTISGGRIYNARNNTERSEIFFREAGIVAFLYFGQSIFQNAFTKLLKGGSGLGFDATRFLHQTYGKHKRDQAFMADFKAAKKQLHAVLSMQNTKKLAEGTGLSFWKNMMSSQGQRKIRQAQHHAYENEKALVESIHQYFSPTVARSGKSTNMIFETARACGWIPTLENNKALLDLTRKIDTQAIFGFVNHMETALAEQVGKVSAEKMMHKAVNRRGVAWLAANGVCTLFLSYIAPKIQHYITYKKTGKHYFPGMSEEHGKGGKG
jgi:hypothetical protein